MQKAEAIKKIVLIVHPSYFYARTRFWKAEIDTTDMKFKSAELTFPDHYNTQIQHDLHNYGRIVLEAAKSPDTLLVMVQTPKTLVWKKVLWRLRRFEEFSKRTLGGRYVEIPPSFGIRLSPAHKSAIEDAKKKLAKFNFETYVRVQPTGQYTDSCVLTSQNLIGKILENRKITVEMLSPIHSHTQPWLKELSLLPEKKYSREIRKLRIERYGKRKPK